MICFNCKAQISDGVSFCTECGSRQPAAGASQAMPFDDATQMASLDATVLASPDVTQAAPFGMNQDVDLDATQAAPFGATQAMPFVDDATQMAPADATQAAPFGATQAFDYDATQAAPFAAAQQSYATVQAQTYPPQNYGYIPPVAPPPAEPPQKNSKGIMIAVAGAVAVLAVVAGVLAWQFLPDLGAPEKKSKKEKSAKESTTAVETVTKPDTDSELVITIPEMTAPEITAPAIIGGESDGILVPTVPHGNDTVDIGSLDLFKPTQAPVAPPTERPKPSAPPATRPQPTNPPVTQDNNSGNTNAYVPPEPGYYDEMLEEPYALVDPYEDCVHIGVNTYDDDGSAFYREYGYFYKGENLCLFMLSGNESAIVEVDEYSGEMSAYLNEGNGYYEIETTQDKCEEVKTHIIAMLVELGYDADRVYPEYKYEYLGDDYMDDFGNAEFYDVYDNNSNYCGSIVIDEGTGYYIGVFDENEELVYLSKFIDQSGSNLPYNFR